jgi:hypothetical protein
VLIILDRAVAYWRSLRLPRALAELVETYGSAWDDRRSGYAITSSKPSPKFPREIFSRRPFP